MGVANHLAIPVNPRLLIALLDLPVFLCLLAEYTRRPNYTWTQQKYVIDGLSKDLPPADNNVILDLDKSR